MPVKIAFVIIGSLCVGIGVLGIILPGLPATPFFILAATFYLRGSSRLHKWLIEHPILGKNLRAYQQNKGMSWRSKISVLTMMWTMILISFFVANAISVIRWIVLMSGVVGTIVILRIKTIGK